MGRKKKETQEFTEEEVEQMQEVVPEAEAAIEKLNAEVAQLKDKNLRLLADADNIRKNALKDRQNYIKYKNESIGQDLVQVADDFDRCVAALPEGWESDEKLKSIVEGVKLIQNRFASALTRNSITKIDVKPGDDFNDAIHEAVSVIAAGEENVNKIVAVTASGYMVADKVLRYAKVVVGQ